MILAGIDLAAEPKGTALAIIEFGKQRAKLFCLEQGLNDETLIEKTLKADKVGIDCAFGWPIEFAKFIVRNQDLTNTDLIDGGMDFRRALSFRGTDLVIKELTGRWPLSVSTDRLGLTAMRCAGLLSKYQQAGIGIDRSGAGKLSEVYPGATLRVWDFDTAGYRTEKDKRAKLLEKLKTTAPWLDLSDFADQMLTSTDCFDAVIAALAARAVALGLYSKPTKDQLAKAKVEGWICLPSREIASLI
jgi:predicted nuclease with RNAse H fold